MSRFAAVLRRASDRLELPESIKSRILLEMAGDLEDLYQHHLDQGLDPAEAARRAEEAFATSDEALRHLANIHRSGPGRLTDRLTSPVETWWEKVLLVVLVAAFVAITATTATHERFFLVVSPFVWPIAGLAVAAFGVSLWKLYQVFFRRPADVRRLRSGLGGLLFVVVASLAVSVSGFFFHLYQYAARAFAGAPETVFRMYGVWALLTSTMMILGLLTAILTALVWFLLSNLVARIEQREATSLLAAGPAA